ncbi:MAG: hypothetical protein ACP5PP_04820 [Fervidobacterium sp.]
MNGDVIGIVGDEILVKVGDEISEFGTFPKLNDIIVGYLNSKM